MNRRQLLYIDDDEDDQELFQLAVAEINEGIECVSEVDATNALQRLLSSELKPDTIFLDLNMPNMNGREFLKELRRREALNSIAVIVMSTSPHPALVQPFKEMGVQGFITKPTSYPELVRVLLSWLKS